jgi:PIN domain nuclease of toxin-antitoxin system
LSKAAVDVISTEQKNGEILISSISCWEIAMLIAKDRIAISMDVEAWLNLVKQIDSVRFVSVDNEIAVKSTELPGEFHKDPADRMIVATARKFAASLVTADEKIRSYPHVKTIW